MPERRAGGARGWFRRASPRPQHRSSGICAPVAARQAGVRIECASIKSCAVPSPRDGRCDPSQPAECPEAGGSVPKSPGLGRVPCLRSGVSGRPPASPRTGSRPEGHRIAIGGRNGRKVRCRADLMGSRSDRRGRYRHGPPPRYRPPRYPRRDDAVSDARPRRYPADSRAFAASGGENAGSVALPLR